MPIKNSDGSSNNALAYGAVVVAIIVAIVAVVLSNEHQAEHASANSCTITIEATNTDGSIATKVRMDGDADSCEALRSEISSQTDDSSQATDDSSASDAEATSSASDAAASAPDAASQ